MNLDQIESDEEEEALMDDLEDECFEDEQITKVRKNKSKIDVTRDNRNVKEANIGDEN